MNDDMIDPPEGYASWPFLSRTLDICGKQLRSTYSEANQASLNAQASHRRWVICAAVFATLAVALAIIQLAGFHPLPLAILEGFAVIVAVLAFHWGDKSRKKWLKERHKAERCRLLKFSSLISPDLYRQDVQNKQDDQTLTQYAARLGNQFSAVKDISYGDLEKWLENDVLPSPPGDLALCSLDRLKELRNYYRARRLTIQADYFEEQVERDVKTDTWWRRVLPWFFGVSVVCVAAHLAVSVLPQHEIGFAHLAEKLAIAFAALLPVVSSGIRTWRSAREATRNISRFRAKVFALNNISIRLGRDEIKDDAEAEAALRDMWCSEQIMESEHREWLRLMMEAEWMG